MVRWWPVQFANAKISGGPRALGPAGLQFNWHDMLAGTSEELPELDQLLRPKPMMAFFAFVVLRLIYLAARDLLGMEVRGREVLTLLKPPYILCPNHQSRADPFLVCSTFPRKMLVDVFRVGASMYFTKALMGQLARLINVVPIDPDAQLLRAMRASAAGLRARKILNIYPEGQRSFDGKLLDFKRGAAILATEWKLSIVRVPLDGPYLLWPPKSWRLLLAKVKIRFGEPIDARKLVLDEPN